MTGFLALEDGAVFRGDSVGGEGFAFGEAVFATAMTGYQELVTDPSYSEQILCFTAPMVGNYGVEEERSESRRPHVRGVVMREARGPAWTDWLHDRGIVALSGVDTRSVVLHLREHGSMRAGIVSGEASVDETLRVVREQPAMAGRALVREVSTKEPVVYRDSGRVRVAVVDYGCKRSILRRLDAAGAAVTVYPHDVDADELASHDGVVLSNAVRELARPGDAVLFVPGARREAALYDPGAFAGLRDVALAETGADSGTINGVEAEPATITAALRGATGVVLVTDPHPRPAPNARDRAKAAALARDFSPCRSQLVRGLKVVRYARPGSCATGPSAR